MVARNINTGVVTKPVPYKDNPNFDPKDPASPRQIPDEPHIGSAVNAAPKVVPSAPDEPVRGGTTDPPAGQSGEVSGPRIPATTDAEVRAGIGVDTEGDDG